MPKRALAIAAVASAALLGREARGDSPVPLPVPLVEQTRSELVLIEVYARDYKGNIVTDLRSDELKLSVDHVMQKPQAIQSFEFIPVADERRGPTASEAGPTGDKNAETEGPLSAVQARRQRPRRFLLFFDDSTSSVPHMTAARKAAYDFLDGQGSPTDQFSVVTYDSKKKLEVLVGFTSDRAVVRAALKRSLDDNTRHEDYAAERERRFEEIDKAKKQDSSGGRFGPRASGQNSYVALQQAYATEDTAVMGRVLNTLRLVVDGLAGWDGYKAILMFGDGIPENPSMDYDIDDPRRALTTELAQLALAAAGDEVTLNAIQTEGVVADRPDQLASSARRSNALATLALDTGGIQTRTNDPLKAMTDIERSSHGYYLLAYAPEGPPDGGKHNLSLKCSRQGVTLRYRQFFTRFRPEDARQRSLQAAYSVPEIHDELGAQLAAVAGPVAGGERVVDLVIYVPAGKFLFLPRPGGAAGVAEVGVVALDADGHETLRQSRRVVLGVDMYRALHGGALGFDFYTRVKLPLGAQTLTAVVSDVQSGDVGAAKIDLDKSASAPALHGLSLYSARDRSLWVDVQAKAAAPEASAAAFTVGPALKRRFEAGEKVSCGFKTASQDTDPASLRLEVVRGEEVVRSEPLPKEASAPTLELALPTDGLEPGDYWLRVQQAQPSGDHEIGRILFGIVPG